LACRKGKVSRDALYRWLRGAAFNVIAQNIEKAVSAVIGRLDTADDRAKRLAANDVTGHFLRHTEPVELEARLAAIEERLERS